MAPRNVSDVDRPVEIITWARGIPIRRVPVALARRFLQVCTGVAAETLDQEDLSPLQYAVLAYVNVEPDIDQVGIAARIGVDRNTASVLVEYLEQRGLVERHVNAADRRSKLLRLSRQGAELHERIRPAMRTGQRSILSALPAAEREKFLDQLIQIIKANEAYAIPGSGRRKRGSINRSR